MFASKQSLFEITQGSAVYSSSRMNGWQLLDAHRAPGDDILLLRRATWPAD
ncbi:MAG: hypothetical protein AAF432_16570 [Planctomycetota bacterium]